MWDPRLRRGCAGRMISEEWPVVTGSQRLREGKLGDPSGASMRSIPGQFFPAKGNKCFGPALRLSRQPRGWGREAGLLADLLGVCPAAGSSVEAGPPARRPRPHNGAGEGGPS